MKRAVLNLMMATGAFASFRRANRGKALILMYHRFSQSDDGFSTSARVFSEHLEYLKRHYSLVPLSQLARHIRGGERLPSGLAAITIDDGFRDAYEVAFPLLRQYNAPATVFAVTDFLDRKTWMRTDKIRFIISRSSLEKLETTVNGSTLRLELNGPGSRLDAAALVNEMLKKLPEKEKEEALARIASNLNVRVPELPPDEYAALTWDQAREMDSNGVEIASHTLTHPILTNVDDERLYRELHESRARVESMLGHEVKSFCYPNGNYSERVIREVERAGYDCAVTTRNGLNGRHNNVLLLQRIPSVTGFAQFVKSTSGFEQMQNRLRGCPHEAPLTDSI